MPTPKDTPPASKDTAVDRMLAWCKNNKFVAAIIVFSVAITATARVADSIANLFTKGSAIVSRAAGHRPSPAPISDSTASVVGKALLTFGGTGTGPGLFTDARSIAVDARGNIYVAEYAGSGRVQRFDSTGHFENEWRAASPTHQNYGIAVDRRGIVYVATDSLDEYRGETGQRVGSLRYSVGFSPSPTDVQLSAEGAIVTAWHGDSDDVVFFDGDGRRERRIGAAVSSHNDANEVATHLAVDGEGTVYAIDLYGSSVYKFSAGGKYLSRFGSDGLEPGQFHRLLAIAVDGHGSVYASDMTGIQIFDSEGRFVRRVATASWVMGMAFDDSGALYTVANDKVTKFNISK